MDCSPHFTYARIKKHFNSLLGKLQFLNGLVPITISPMCHKHLDLEEVKVDLTLSNMHRTFFRMSL